MWEWIATNVTFDRIVGILSLLASVFALIAARTARNVAKETREELNKARFSSEIVKLRRAVEALRGAVRTKNWEHASERCSDILVHQAEIAGRFDMVSSESERLKFAGRIRSISKICSRALEEDMSSTETVNLGARVDKEAEFLSTIYDTVQQETEKQLVER